VSNKTNTAAATCVAAIPALALGYFLVNSFLTGLNHLTGIFMPLYAVTLAACAGMIFLPLGVLIFGPKAPKAPKALKAAKPGKKGAAEKDEIAEVGPEDPTVAQAGLDDEKTGSTGEIHVVKDAESEEFAKPSAGDHESSTGEIEVIDDDPTDDTAAFDEEFEHDMSGLDDLAEEDEKPPKKKRK
jgi:hypothetical protein